MNKRSAKLYCLLILLLFVAGSSGCAMSSPPSAPQPPATPSAATLPPSLQKPLPQQSFTKRAEQNTEAWQEKLNKSASKP